MMRSARTSVRACAALASIFLFATSCTGSSDSSTGDPGNWDGSKIGFIFVGARDDIGYNQAAWEGSESLARAFPNHDVLRVENVPETEAATAAMEDLINQGAKIIFATSFGHLPFAYEVAENHPEVVVLHQGGVEPEPHLSNLGTYWGRVFEPVFLAGMAAGRATQTGRLGFVAAFPIPATFGNVNAFTLGARSVRPDARTIVRFTGDWCDPGAQRTAAEALLAKDVDVLTQHQDCTGTVLEVAEASGIFSVGYHSDGSEVAPTGWLVGSVWHWDDLFVDITQTVLDGDFEGSAYEGDFRAGLASGTNPFILTEFGPMVAPQTARLIRRTEDRFVHGSGPFRGPIRDRDGNLKVSAGATPSQAEIDAMDYLVEGVVGQLP